MSSVMPHSVCIEKGIGRPGFTSVEKDSAIDPSLILMAAISMISWTCGLCPVVTVWKTHTSS